MFGAIKYNDVNRLKKDIFRGGDINQKDTDGDTPILKSIKTDRHDCFEFLLHSGADLFIEDSEGQNAINLIIDGRKYEYILSLVRAGHEISADKDLLMQQITHREPILRNTQDLPPEAIETMEMHYCKAVSTLYHYYGPEALTYQTGAVILYFIGSILISMCLENGQVVIVVTVASPDHPVSLTKQNLEAADWYNLLVEDNRIAIQAGLLTPYTRGDLIDLIDNLHDAVIEKYLEATGR